jgi:hypothetical protein
MSTEEVNAVNYEILGEALAETIIANGYKWIEYEDNDYTIDIDWVSLLHDTGRGLNLHIEDPYYILEEPEIRAAIHGALEWVIELQVDLQYIHLHDAKEFMP